MARDHGLGLRGALPAVPEREADPGDEGGRGRGLRRPEHRAGPGISSAHRLVHAPVVRRRTRMSLDSGVRPGGAAWSASRPTAVWRSPAGVSNAGGWPPQRVGTELSFLPAPI